MKFKKNKPIKKICGNCQLYRPDTSDCSVMVLHEGEKLNIPVDAQDSCFFEQDYFDPINQKKEDFNEIKQIRAWVEDENGEKTNKDGVVKIELPEELEVKNPLSSN